MYSAKNLLLLLPRFIWPLEKKKKEGSTVVDASVFITSISLEAQRH